MSIDGHNICESGVRLKHYVISYVKKLGSNSDIIVVSIDCIRRTQLSQIKHNYTIVIYSNIINIFIKMGIYELIAQRTTYRRDVVKPFEVKHNQFVLFLLCVKV